MRHHVNSKHPIAALNITQFLGALNDNVFKYLIVFLLINLMGAAHSTEILFWVGTIYVLPFLLFSSNAGILADKFSKQRLMIALKLLEVLIMVCGVIAFIYQSKLGLYVLMFLLSLQSALFSPPKYSIIPELVSKELISKANGIITSGTYLAIIAGTFLASFITQITDKDFVFAGFTCLVIALIGWGSSFAIPYVPPKKTHHRMNIFFIRTIFHTLRDTRHIPYLLLAITGSAFFLFLGAFFQLNVIPYAINSLNLSEVGGGYLFLICAIGIACGAQLAGRISRKHVEIGLPCVAGILMGITLLVLYWVRGNLVTVIPVLFLLGLFSGFFVIPFDAFVQTFTPDKRRGQVIAANNFLSFCGVLLAPVFLYLISGIFNFSAAVGFILIGVLSLLYTCSLWIMSGSLLLNFIARHFLVKKHVKPINVIKIQSDSWDVIAHVMASTPFFKLHISQQRRSLGTWLLTRIHDMTFVTKKPKTTGDYLHIFWHLTGKPIPNWKQAKLRNHQLHIN